MAIWHCFSFVTALATSFGCNRFRPHFVSKLLCTTIWSSCGLRLESERTYSARTDRRFRFAASSLHRIRLGTCYSLFLHKDQWMIKRLSQAMSAALVCNRFSRNSSKFQFYMKKSNRVEISTTIPNFATLWLSNWFSNARVVALLFQASLSLLTASAAD